MNSLDIAFHSKLRRWLQGKIDELSCGLWQNPQASLHEYREIAGQLQAFQQILEECEGIRKDIVGEERGD